MRRRRRIEPGEVAAWALMGSGLGASVLLIRKGHSPVSSCVRGSWPLKAVVLYGSVHLLCTLPWDPLTKAGERLGRRVVDAVTP